MTNEMLIKLIESEPTMTNEEWNELLLEAAEEDWPEESVEKVLETLEFVEESCKTIDDKESTITTVKRCLGEDINETLENLASEVYAASMSDEMIMREEAEDPIYGCDPYPNY